MYIEIGSDEAKAKFPELLRGVQLGNRYTITLCGEAIADLIPSVKLQKYDVAAGVALMQRLILRNSQMRGATDTYPVRFRELYT